MVAIVRSILVNLRDKSHWLIRVFAYIIRFTKRSKSSRDFKGSDHSQEISFLQNKNIPRISFNEQQQAIYRLIKIIQTRHFSSEVKALSSCRAVPTNSSILKLNPFLDDSGILRIGGRLRESSLPYASKHPMLLPGNHPFSRLIVIHEHERHFHAGPQATLAAVRERYWLTFARNVIPQILRRYIVYFKSSPRFASAIMGNLLEPRVKISSKIFGQCGVDYAGSLYYKEGARRS
ncbi:PREDICTED: uncharacterized protein LOC105143779 [Acromyrmex echinatior]|uniref:uncharacterized protein LOC105143779 n=1 Tax=Acromyrmex echinatior TaxID=103372 RepID=UPI000580D64D|nr:PREDICTED: uncharacterized protein LOC105143779 [Acromyrmex echinatior]